MLTDAEKEEKLAASPAPRVTKEYMESRIAETTFTRFTQNGLESPASSDRG